MTQRVLVTAGASGIGKEIARAFVASGATVCVCDIDVKAMETAAKDIPGLLTTACDISKRQDIEHMVAAAVELLGGLDVLVNNAGVSGPTAPVEEMDPDAWDKVMQVDLTGTFNVTRMAIPYLKKSSAGVIINMSSQMGHVGAPNRTVYCMTKHAIEGLTKAMAVELAPLGIRVNSVAPTYVETPMTRPFLANEAFRRSVVDRIPLGRIGTIDEVVAAVTFLASPAAGLITGASLLADGGYTAQ